MKEKFLYCVTSLSIYTFYHLHYLQGDFIIYGPYLPRKQIKEPKSSLKSEMAEETIIDVNLRSPHSAISS